MKHLPPFEAPDGTRSPAGERPFDLIQFALQHGGLRVVRYDATVQEVRLVQAPPATTCTSESGLHLPVGLANHPRFGFDCHCGERHLPAEECAVCGQLVPYHDFPGRGLRLAVLVVDAPVGVGENLQGPPGKRDGYLLFHIPRATLDAFDEEASRRIVVPGNGLVTE